MNPKVSVIIPTYNRCKDLMNCIESICNNIYTNIEIIVVDNASSDGTESAVKNSIYYGLDNFIYIKLPENVMAAGGRNAGIKKAQGDYLLFVDSDNIIDKNMIDQLVKEMEQNSQIGLIGPLMLYYKKKDMIWFVNNSINKMTSRTTYYHQNEIINLPPKTELLDTDHIPNVFMTRRKIILHVQSFDPIYYIMYEEADFAARIRASGYQIKVLTSAVTYHNVPLPDEETTNEMRKLGCDDPQRTYHFSKNRSIYMRKFAPWYGKILYFCIFEFVFAFCYSYVSIKNHRYDITKSWWKGLVKGISIKINR